MSPFLVNRPCKKVLFAATLLHGSADWRRELGGVGRRLLPGYSDPRRAVQSQGSLSPPHSEAAAPVTNWAEYDAALRARRRLTVWFMPAAVAAWVATPRATRGGQRSYSDLAIATALTLKAVFRRALRQSEGRIGSILQLLGLDLPVPEHSTVSRRAETLRVPRPQGSRIIPNPAEQHS
jgi:hypothetical protein